MAGQTYFCYTNTNRKPFLKGEQVFNCYGNYSNRSLMRTYGFCFPNNRYEAVTIYIVLDKSKDKEMEDIVRQLPPYHTKMHCQYARLKTDQLSDKLVYTIRKMLRSNTTDFLTKPTEIEVEVRVMEMYRKVLGYLQE